MTGAEGTALRTVLDTGAGLVRRLAVVPRGARFDGVAGPGGELWFVIAGSGVLASGGGAERADRPVRADTSVWLPPGAGYGLRAGDDGELRMDSVVLPAGAAGATKAAARPTPRTASAT